MKRAEPSLLQKIALLVAGVEILLPFAISVTLFLFIGVLLSLKSDCSIGMWVIGVFCLPMVVFIALAITFKWLSRHYVYVMRTGNSGFEHIIFEVDDQGYVVKYSVVESLLKTLPGRFTYHEASLGDDMLRIVKKKRISHEFELKLSSEFELLITVSLILKRNGDFDPQQVYELLVRAGFKELEEYFVSLFKQAVSENQEKLTKLGISYHTAEITESQFCQEILKILRVPCQFSNLKVSQLMMDEPIRFSSGELAA